MSNLVEYNVVIINALNEILLQKIESSDLSISL